MTYPWAPTQTSYQPEVKWWEQPKQWGEAAQEKIGEGISKTPILPDVLQFVAPVFEWIHEELEKPFAAIMTSPFSPDLQWEKGESWKEHKIREYDAWDAPMYVKGATEFAMPLWWMPWFSWAKAGSKAISLGSKSATAIAKSGKLATVAQKGLPASEVLDNTLFRAGRLRSAMENVPVVNRIVKMIGGEGAFITQKEAQRVAGLTKGKFIAKLPEVDALIKTKMELVKMGFVADMRNGIKGLLVPKLQVLGKLDNILGMDSKGVIKNIVDNTGKSQYLYDVVEGAVKNPESYTFLSKEAKVYIDTVREVLDDVYTLARKEGVKVPKDTMVHRIVRGKTGVKGYEASEYGSLFEVERTHKLMKEGVEQVDKLGRPTPVDYGLDINESISSTIDHYVRKISRKRFETQVGKLGMTPKRMWEMTPEGQELSRLRQLGESEILSYADEIKRLSTERGAFLKHYSGKQIIGEGLAKFNAHPVFKNSLFPKDVVKTTEKLLNDDSQKWLSNASTISGTSRMLTAAMDLSAPFIQGAAAWGRNPVAWTKGVKNMMEFVIKPENYYKYLNDPVVMATRMERIMAGGSSSTFEFFQALKPLQKQFEKIPIAGKPLAKGIGQTYGRAETAFTGFGEVTRNELWKALKKPGMSPEALTDLTRTIDRMTGVMSTEALAIGKTQQDFENAFVFFAPRYTRAGLSFVSDAFRGGMSGAEARKALGSLMAAGTMFYYGASKVLDQQPNFNPDSGRFMTIKVGESHVGVGGIMTAMLRLAYDVSVTAVEDPINLIKPLSDGHLNRWDNPFVKFLYSRTAPMTSLITSAAFEQANYFGEPLETFGDWAGFMKDKVTPIALQNIGRDPQAVTAIAEFGGLRVFPKSPWELMDEERDKVAMSDFGQPYDNLNDLDQTRVDKADTIRKLQADVDTQTATRGDTVSVGFLNRQRERDTARLVYEENVNNLQEAYDAGAIDGIKFREELSNAGYGLGATYKHIDTQPEYKDVLKTLKEPRKIKDKHLEDIAHSEFIDNMYKTDSQGNSIFEDQFGIFQYDKYNAYIEQFKAKYGEEIYQYVQERKDERDSTMPLLYHEYQRAKEILKPYWGVADEVEELFGKQYAESSRGQSLISRLRKTKRLQNPEMEKYYQMFYAQKQ